MARLPAPFFTVLAAWGAPCGFVSSDVSSAGLTFGVARSIDVDDASWRSREKSSFFAVSVAPFPAQAERPAPTMRAAIESFIGFFTVSPSRLPGQESGGTEWHAKRF